MKKLPLSLFAFALLLTISGTHARADSAADSSFQTRMRETLRNTMQQLSDAQGQLATAQAAQAQSEKDKADLQAKLDAVNAQLKTVNEQSATDRDTAAKSIATLNDQVAAQTKQIGAQNEAIAQWKAAYSQVTQLAKSTEAARVQLYGEKVVLDRLVDDRELKNAELYRTGTEILDRYEKFSLGDALTAKEPFVGTTRVHLQTLVQDYQDKLLDNRISSGQPPTTPPPPAAKSPSMAKSEDGQPLQSTAP